MSTAEKLRAYRGPALLSYGFRPFFLGGALWAALVVAIWLPLLAGRLTLPTAFSPLAWHVHELVWGYVPAIVAGFLLTAVPNWTGRLPVTGTPLLVLVLLWGLGRAAVLASAVLGAPTAMVLDLAFLVALGGVIGREIVAGENWRNLRVLALVGLLLVSNAAFHVEAMLGSSHGFGLRGGIAAVLLLIMLIGGRIIPSFTRNWLVRRGPGRLPEAFGKTDMGIMGASAVALLAWTVTPESRVTAVLALLAGALNAWRLWRWAGWRTAAEPLVLVLHVAFAFVPLGFWLVAAAILAPQVMMPTGALHAWTAGAIALMTLAVMTRASLGHTGQPLVATRPIQLIYVLTALAALTRIAAAFGVARDPLLVASAGFWVLGFTGFVVVYGPLLIRGRS